MPEHAVTSVAFFGNGLLYAADVLARDVVYHLNGWPDAAGDLHLCGVLRAVNGADLRDVVGLLDVTLHLDGAWWWNCIVVNTDGWTTTRDGGLHRREAPPDRWHAP